MKRKRVQKVRRASSKVVSNAAPDTSWLDDVTQGMFWKPSQGRNTVKITGPITKRMSQWGKPSYDLPTDQGVFSTGSISFIQPLAEFVAKHNRNPHALLGRTLTFVCKGSGKARQL